MSPPPRLSGAVFTANLKLYRELLGADTVDATLSRTPQFYRKGHDTGELSSTILGPGFARLTLTGWPEIPEMRLHGVAAGVTAVLRVAGRRSVSLTFERTADGARFDARWKA